MEEKRMAGSYEIMQALQVGRNEVVLGEDENAAPGVSSAILTVGGLMSGAWMPLETMGSFETVCRFLPFYPAVDMGRALVIGDTLTFGRFGVALLTVCGYLLLAALLAVVAFRRQKWGD